FPRSVPIPGENFVLSNNFTLGCQGKKRLVCVERETENRNWVRAENAAPSSSATLCLGENADRQYHHVASGKLQPLLQRVRGVIVEHASEDIFLFKNQLAAKKHNARKLLR